MVRIGINPLTWTNDDLPELGGDTPLEICLGEAAAAGYAGIELGHKFPRNAQFLRPLLDAHGLALISGWHSGRVLEHGIIAEIQAIAAHRRLLLAMGCTVTIFAEVSGCVHGDRTRRLSARPVLADADWPAFGAALTAVADHLAARGIGFAYHHHMGTVVQTEAEIDRLMAESGDSVGLLLDTGHLVFAGGDPVAVARRHGPRIRHVHCKDVRPAVLAEVLAGDRSFLDAVLAGVFTVPGDGGIDYAPVLAALAEADYSGWLVVEAEQDPAKADPPTYARMGFESLYAAATAAGLDPTARSAP